MVATRLRRRLKRRRDHAPEPDRRQGLGEPPTEEAGDAQLDELRGELVRELDRMASDTSGSACFRRA